MCRQYHLAPTPSRIAAGWFPGQTLTWVGLRWHPPSSTPQQRTTHQPWSPSRLCWSSVQLVPWCIPPIWLIFILVLVCNNISFVHADEPVRLVRDQPNFWGLLLALVAVRFDINNAKIHENIIQMSVMHRRVFGHEPLLSVSCVRRGWVGVRKI